MRRTQPSDRIRLTKICQNGIIKCHKEREFPMDQTKWKRVFSIFAAVVLIIAFGCGKAAAAGTTLEDAPNETVATGSESDGIDSDSEPSSYIGSYNVDETTDEATGGSFLSGAADENAILVQNAGAFTVSGADIQKTGDAQNGFSGGTNAAVAAVSKGQIKLTGSRVTTDALGGFGLIASGEGSSLSAENGDVSTAGESSPAIVAANGGTVVFSGGTLSTEGTDSPCVLLEGGSVSFKGVSLSAASGELLRVLSGANALTLDNTGMTANPIIGEGSTLKLTLLNGAAFSGELGNEPPAKVSISLDAVSTLTLAADTYLVALVNADTAHQNIQSNGYSLYYDSNAPENAYLNSQSYALPGGGYLTPMI